MNGYSGACGEKDWFLQIDIVPAVCCAAWEILASSGQARQVSGDALQQEVADSIYAELDLHLIRKAVRQSVEETCSDDTIRSKLDRALTKSMQPALEKVLGSTAFQQARQRFDERNDLKLVENFAKEWIEEVANRIWGTYENNPDLDLEGTLTALFQRLVAPFGVESEFTCIPGVLCGRIGRPPPDWDHIPKVVDQVVNKWNGGSQGPAKKRKKEDDASAVPASRPFVAFGGSAGKKKGSVQQEATEYAEDEAAVGHPLCTSLENCIGNPEDRTVRHLLKGVPADTYCEPCWESFRARHPNLEGEWQD
jgi:hypothetical protein